MQAITDVVKFETPALTVTTINPKNGAEGTRLMNVGEFKKANGVKGNAASKAYNEYLRVNGKANTGELAKQMAEGKLLVTGFTNYTNSIAVRFVKAESIVDKAPKDSTPAKPVAIGDVFAGLSDEAKAAFIAQFIGKAA